MSSPIPPDPYRALSVSKDADISAIRSAYRKLVLKHHPDRIQDPALKDRGKSEFQKIQQAYELLSDPTRRSRYDDAIKLTELRRDAMSRDSTPRHTAPPRRTPTSASREWNSDDQAFYEVRQPREPFFDSKDRFERFEESARPSSRKNADYERTTPKKSATSAGRPEKAKASPRFAAEFPTASPGLKTKADPERKKDSRSYAREQEQRTREKTKARQEKSQQSRHVFVSDDSDSDTATRVTSSTIRPSYHASARRSQDPETRPAPHHQRSHSYPDYESEDESLPSDKWHSHHSNSMEYIQKRAAEAGHKRPHNIRQSSGSYWNGRKNSTDEGKYGAYARTRHDEAPPRPSMPTHSSAPSKLKAQVEERIPKEAYKATASYPIRERGRESDHKKDMGSPTGIHRDMGREFDHRKEMRSPPGIHRAHTMPMPKSSSKKDSAPSKSSKLKQTETHDSGYGSSSTPHTPELREQSPSWPKETKTTYHVFEAVSDDDDRTQVRRVDSDSDRRACRARSPDNYTRQSRREKSDKSSARPKTSKMDPTGRPSSSKDDYPRVHRSESSRYDPHSPRDAAPPPLSRHSSARDRLPYEHSDSDRDRERERESPRYRYAPDKVFFRPPFPEAQYSNYREPTDRRGHDQAPGSRFSENVRLVELHIEMPTAASKGTFRPSRWSLRRLKVHLPAFPLVPPPPPSRRAIPPEHNSALSKPQSLASSYRQIPGGRSRMPLSHVTPNRKGTGERGAADEPAQQHGDISRRTSDADPRFLDNDIPENMWRPDEDDPEGWIHRDKLARIESEELQAAGIGLATRRQYGKSGWRGSSRDRKADDTFERREDKTPRLAESPLTEEEGERMNWDLRSADEVAAEPINAAQPGSQSALKKGGSRIPVLTSSPHPIPPERLERDTPLPRKRTISNSMSPDEAAWVDKKHARKSSSASQTALDTAEGASTPAGRSSTGSKSASPLKQRAPLDPSSASGSPSSNKLTPTPASKALVEQKNDSGQNPAGAGGAGAGPAGQRSQIRAQEPERPRTAVNRPEGDPPWLATMYKPDPRLPPDQQIIPTHARLQQAAQWEAEGAVPKTYDRNFVPLAVHDAETLVRPAPTPSSPAQDSRERTGQQGAWPLKSSGNSKNANDGRPGTGGSSIGAYTTMPKVVNVPSAQHSSLSGSRPTPPVRLQESGAQGRRGEKEEDDGMVKKGCGCCAVINNTSNTAKLSFLNPIRTSIRSLFTAPTISAAAMSAAKQKAQKIIDENGVVVFSKSWCPYCRATKSLLNEKQAKFYLLELDEVDDGSEIQDALEDLTGQRSVPNIFIGQKHIGGNSDLQSKRGQLDGLNAVQKGQKQEPGKIVSQCLDRQECLDSTVRSISRALVP
ncbi:hypothetical protein DV735_g3069, partial [Chaetothyriales sp. CBS 134920]